MSPGLSCREKTRDCSGDEKKWTDSGCAFQDECHAPVTEQKTKYVFPGTGKMVCSLKYPFLGRV